MFIGREGTASPCRGKPVRECGGMWKQNLASGKHPHANDFYSFLQIETKVNNGEWVEYLGIFQGTLKFSNKMFTDC